MRPIPRLVIAALLVCAASQAWAQAGARDFADTMQIDDPSPNDQIVFPTVTWQRSGAADGNGPSQQTEMAFEFDKRITARLGLQIGSAATLITTTGAKRRTGLENLEVGLQYALFESKPSEFIASVGLLHEFGATGSAQVGAERSGSTTPVLYAAKGLGDLPIGVLRPLAITGELGYAVADRALKLRPDGTDNGGLENRWVGGLTVQYPLNYLDGEVLPLDLPQWIDNFTPLVEIAWSSPAMRPGNEPAQWTIAPGVIWSNDFYGIGVEALIPGNRASGRNVGVMAQFRMALGVLAPGWGRPLFGGGE